MDLRILLALMAAVSARAAPDCRSYSGPYSVQLPHESDCNKYYVCSYGAATLMSCGEGTEFNPVLNVCDWPENSGCLTKLTTPKSSTSTAHPTSEPTGTPNFRSGPTSIDPGEIIPGCPPDNPYSYLLPNQKDCNKYYSCSNGVAVPMKCGEGLHFNPNYMVCDWPERAGCNDKGQGTTREPNLSTSEHPFTTLGPNVSTSKTTHAPTTRTTSGQSNPHSSVPVSTSQTDPGSTTKYDGTTEPNVSLEETDPSLTTLNDLLTDWDDVNSESDESTPVMTYTTNGDSTSESDASTTEYDEESATLTVPGCPPDDPNRFNLPNPTDCSKYYSCSNGYPYSMQCPHGLHFNAELMVCDWPDHAGCDASKLSTERTEPIIMEGCPPEDPHKYMLPDKTSCNKFFSCADGLAFPMRCGEGLYFNQELQICDWPYNVDCTLDATTTADIV